MKTKLLALAGLLLVAAALIFSLGAPEKNIEAAKLSTDLFTRFSPEGKISRQLPMMRTPVRYEIAGRRYRAHLYRPINEPRAGVVLLYDSTIGQQAMARMVEFAGVLAEHKILVLVPEIGSANRLSVTVIRDAFEYLSELPDIGAHERTGIIVFGRPLSAVITASAGKGIRTKVKFILAIDGIATSLKQETIVGIQAHLIYINTGKETDRTRKTIELVKKHFPNDQYRIYHFERRYTDRKGPGIIDRWQAWRLVYDVLVLRDGSP